MQVDKKKVGQKIKSLRLNKGMTQEEFGKLFGATRGNVATWERGVSLPNNERLKLIADLSSMTVNELLHNAAEAVIQNSGVTNYSGFQNVMVRNESFRDEDKTIPYQLTLIREEAGHEDKKEGEFEIVLKFPDDFGGREFRLNCEYRPYELKPQSLIVFVDKEFNSEEDLYTAANHYDNVADALNPLLARHIQNAIEDAIKIYFIDKMRKPISIDVWHNL